MIKLKPLLKEAEDKKVARMDLDSTAAAVLKFVEKNKKKLEKLLDDNIDEFYEMGYEEFPNADQDDVAQEMNKAALVMGWFENEDIAELPTDKDLELAAFGDKKLQKGVKMGDYDKKMKSPKASPTELKPEQLKKLKTESSKYAGSMTEMAIADSKKIDSFLSKLSTTVKNSKVVDQITNFIMIARLDPEESYRSLLKDLLLFYKTNTEVINIVQQELQESKKKDLTKAEPLEEAEYQGRKVTLNKPFYTPGGPRKRAVYVKNDKGNVVKVGFGDPNMRIKKSIPARRKSYRARHHCETPGPKWKANYWSCRAW